MRDSKIDFGVATAGIRWPSTSPASPAACCSRAAPSAPGTLSTATGSTTPPSTSRSGTSSSPSRPCRRRSARSRRRCATYSSPAPPIERSRSSLMVNFHHQARMMRRRLRGTPWRVENVAREVLFEEKEEEREAMESLEKLRVFVVHMPLPGEKEIERMVVQRKKMGLLRMCWNSLVGSHQFSPKQGTLLGLLGLGVMRRLHATSLLGVIRPCSFWRAG